MPADDHPRVPAGVEREVGRVGREGQPLLPHRRGRPVGIADGLDLLPGDVGVVEVPEGVGPLTRPRPPRTLEGGPAQPPETSWIFCFPAVTKGIMSRSSAPTFSIGWSEPGLAQGLVVGAAVGVLGHPLLGEGAVPDLRQDPAHLVSHRLVDDPGAPGQVAVLGGVRDGEPHAADPLLVHQVDDELELVQALEVGGLGLVAGAHQRLVPGLHQGGQPAAQHHLLAEEVGLGLLGEGGVEHAGPGGADGVGVGQGQVVGLAGRVGRHRHQRGHARRPRCRCGAPGARAPWAPPWPRPRRPAARSGRSGC